MTVAFSPEEWGLLDAAERLLYCEVMLEICTLVASVGKTRMSPCPEGPLPSLLPEIAVSVPPSPFSSRVLVLSGAVPRPVDPRAAPTPVASTSGESLGARGLADGFLHAPLQPLPEGDRVQIPGFHRCPFSSLSGLCDFLSQVRAIAAVDVGCSCQSSPDAEVCSSSAGCSPLLSLIWTRITE